MAGKVARGDIRFFRFPEPDKQRPVLVLTRDSIIDHLSRITLADEELHPQMAQIDADGRRCYLRKSASSADGRFWVTTRNRSRR